MVISQKYRYVFVEYPMTGSTAISAELVENYGGVRVLFKHARYQDFLEHATPDQRKYFSFSGIRNPMDEAVSRFFKYRNQHRGDVMNPKFARENGGWVTAWHRERFEYCQRPDVDFASYFLRYYKRGYDDWTRLHHRSFNHVIRFEQVTEGFNAVLRSLKIEPVRALPVKNKTAKEGHFLSYYTPEIRQRAVEVFGPYMSEWGYSFPAEWNVRTSLWVRLRYRMRASGRRRKMANQPMEERPTDPLPRDIAGS